MAVSVPVWLISAIGMAVLLALGAVLARRRLSRRHGIIWLGVSVTLAVLFGAGAGLVGHDSDPTVTFFSEYAVETVFAFDTVLAFAVILRYVQLPKEHWPLAAVYGVAGTVVARGIFSIVMGQVIQYAFWLLYLIGFLSIYAGWKLVRKEAETEEQPKPVERAARLFGRLAYLIPRRYAAPAYLPPMVLATMALTISDPFAWPDAPDVYLLVVANFLALSTVPILVGAAARIADLMGYVPLGMAVCGGFVGVKVLLAALAGNAVPFINGGENTPWAPDIPPWMAFAVVTATAGIAVVASLINASRRRKLEPVPQTHEG